MIIIDLQYPNYYELKSKVLLHPHQNDYHQNALDWLLKYFPFEIIFRSETNLFTYLFIHYPKLIYYFEKWFD